MIRMGRGSKPDQPETPDYPNYATNPESRYQYGSEASQAPSRVITDSESMARDIKEGRLSGFVGHGTSLTGDTNFQMMLRVDGNLQGTVTSDTGTLIVGTNGQVDANVTVAAAMVNGTINGDVIATEKIQLGRTAKVIGNVQTPRLIMEDGSIIEGSCSMIKARDAQEKKENETKAQYTTSQQTSYSTASVAAEDEDDSEEYSTSSEDEDDNDEEESVEAASV